MHALPEDIDAGGDRYAAGWEKLRNKRWERIKELGIVQGELSKVEPQIGPPYHFPDVLEMEKQWNIMLDEIREVAPQKSTE